MARSRKSAATALRKRPRQTRSREMVEAMIEAAARVLRRHGYARTTTNLVAEVAGVSVGSLYQYFPNKESLVAALHERHARELRGVLGAALAGAEECTLDETVRVLIRATLDAHLLDPDLHRVLEGEVPELDRFDGVDDLDAAMVAQVRGLLAAHRKRIAPPDLDLAAQVVVRIVDSLVHVAVIESPQRLASRAVEREIERAVLGYLGRRD